MDFTSQYHLHKCIKKAGLLWSRIANHHNGQLRRTALIYLNHFYAICLFYIEDTYTDCSLYEHMMGR